MSLEARAIWQGWRDHCRQTAKPSSAGASCLACLRRFPTRYERSILGTTLPFPIFWHPLGYIDTTSRSRSRSCQGGCYARCDHPEYASSKSLEEVAGGKREDDSLVSALLEQKFELNAASSSEPKKRAKRHCGDAGYQTPRWRETDSRMRICHFCWEKGSLTISAIPLPPGSPSTAEENPFVGDSLFYRHLGNPAMTWQDLASCVNIPAYRSAQGIMHPDDAPQSDKHWRDGIIVSNHGGRQVEGAKSSDLALPDVVAAVEGRFPFSSTWHRSCFQISSRPLALGARAVLLGRPYLWGLALAGEARSPRSLAQPAGRFDLTLA